MKQGYWFATAGVVTIFVLYFIIGIVSRMSIRAEIYEYQELFKNDWKINNTFLFAQERYWRKTIFKYWVPPEIDTLQIGKGDRVKFQEIK